MEKVMFEVGLPLSLEIPKEKGCVRIHVVGWEQSQYFIAKLPSSRQKPVKLKSKDRCLIRFLKDDTAFGFETEVISIQFYPVSLVFFKYPEEIETVAFRVCKRFKTNIPAKLLDSKQVTVTQVVIEDISEKGCLLKVLADEKVNFAADTIHHLTFRVLETTLENINCLIKNQHTRNNYQMLGVEFCESPEKQLATLQSFICLFEKTHDS